MSPGSRTTPLTDEARAEFASYAAAIVRGAPSLEHVIVGNEPNLNRFWLPQFGLDGYERRARRVPRAPRADVRRAEGRLARRPRLRRRASPRVAATGPVGSRPTHSPTRFIQELGSRLPRERTRSPRHGRVRHPSRMRTTRASRRRPRTRTRRRSASRTTASSSRSSARRSTAPRSPAPSFRSSTASSASSRTSRRRKASLYTGTEPTTTKPVSESTQAAYYEEALALAFCQPNVEGMLLFLSRDERARSAWQSGIHYVDGTPKSSRARVTEALDRTTGGSITRCPGVQLPVRPTSLRFGTRSAAKRGVFRVSLPLRPRLPLLGAPRERGHALRRSSRRRARPRSASSSRPISGRVG